jgi:hypothetical protein
MLAGRAACLPYKHAKKDSDCYSELSSSAQHTYSSVEKPVTDGQMLMLCEPACLQEHTSALLSLKARLAEAGVQIPWELVVHGDLDATLYRFLRARKYNVQLAYAMLESG